MCIKPGLDVPPPEMPALAPSMEEDCTPHVHRSHALAPEQLQRLADRLGVTVQTLPRGLTSDSANGLLHAFISVVPKAELHIHIEGSLEPSMMLELAEVRLMAWLIVCYDGNTSSVPFYSTVQRNGMPAPYPSVEAAQAAYNFADLQSFLDLYYNGCAVLKTTRDFYDLAWAYLRKAAANRVVHAEIFFDPQTHLANGAGFDVFMPGFLKACELLRHWDFTLVLHHAAMSPGNRDLDLDTTDPGSVHAVPCYQLDACKPA
ncbi:A_deaminase domain-containing protein [Haematococcus lacustris]|uniref:A_deaminase domain-containing protein n=1 Tax=Haematococcus lacustris TaxID=44745 RepID=A0A6A0A402_HAELA|nr:A_deaminase domain-containing protein [Haematococcus lacustris]